MSSTTQLGSWTIFYSPADYPGRFVVRGFEIVKGEIRPLDAELFDNLESARQSIPPQAIVRFDRFPEDDPSVVEVWM